MDPLLGRTDPGRTGERELGRKEPEPGGLGVVEVPKTMLSKSDRRTHGEHTISLIQFSPLISNTISIWNILPQSIALSPIALILSFQRNVVCISILISSQALLKVFWKFKIWPPVHSDAYIGIDSNCVTPSADNLWYIDTFSSSNLYKYWYFLTFYNLIK